MFNEKSTKQIRYLLLITAQNIRYCTTFNCDFELMLNTFNWFNFAFHSNFHLDLCIIFKCLNGMFTEVARALPLIWNILRLKRHENPFLVLSLNGWKWFQIARVFQRGANVSGWSKSDVSSLVFSDMSKRSKMWTFKMILRQLQTGSHPEQSLGFTKIHFQTCKWSNLVKIENIRWNPQNFVNCFSSFETESP